MDLSDILAQFDPSQLKPRLQAGAAIGSGLAGQAVGGLNAIPTALTQGADAASQQIADTQSAFQYQPTDPKAQALIQQLQAIPGQAKDAYNAHAPTWMKGGTSALGDAWDDASQRNPMLAAGITAAGSMVNPEAGEGSALLDAVKATTTRPTAETTLALRNMSGPQTVKSLSQAFDSAVSDHLAMDPDARKQNSKDMKARLQPYMGNGTLLSKNGKMMKSEAGYEGGTPIKLPDGRGVETTGLSLHPAYEEDGISTCPNSASCKTACLGKTSGGNFMFGGGGDLDALQGPRLSHFNTTMAMLGDPQAFAVRLNDEIQAAKMKAAANGNKLGVRLNVLSDINPRVHQSIIKAHPDVDFYDYTKNASNPVADNHHYTYSSTGVSNPDLGIQNDNQNWSRMRNRLDGGSNVAMSFSVKGKPGDGKLPATVHDAETGKQYSVVDGDTHDYRPMDRQPPGSPGVVVGLRNKANTTKQSTAAVTSNGFFVHHDPAAGSTVTIHPQTRAKVALTNDKAPDMSDQVVQTTDAKVAAYNASRQAARPNDPYVQGWNFNQDESKPLGPLGPQPSRGMPADWEPPNGWKPGQESGKPGDLDYVPPYTAAAKAADADSNRRLVAGLRAEESRPTGQSNADWQRLVNAQRAANAKAGPARVSVKKIKPR